jgi:hypothetical protein
MSATLVIAAATLSMVGVIDADLKVAGLLIAILMVSSPALRFGGPIDG